jgi:predicted HAD superfamily Cof-like phosphohydrolase
MSRDEYLIDHVLEFHTAFDLPVNRKPTIPTKAQQQLRIRLIREELNELEFAMENGDIVETLDALADLDYVVTGAWLETGVWRLRHVAAREVHRSNMTKVWDDGTVKKRADGKVLKPDTYSPANLPPLLELLRHIDES